MKTINWLTLNQFSIDDVVVFMHWLGFTSKGHVTSAQLRERTPIRSSKLPDLLKILSYFEFAVYDGEKLQITRDGRDFNRANTILKIELMKRRILASAIVQDILSILEQSPNGRLSVDAMAAVLQKRYDLEVSCKDISGLISWACTCKVFGHDKERHEIIRLGGRLPQNPLLPGLAS
jgi:C-terminal AAA-associated domain